jgi:hypothetical protein
MDIDPIKAGFVLMALAVLAVCGFCLHLGAKVEGLKSEIDRLKQTSARYGRDARRALDLAEAGAANPQKGNRRKSG